MDAIELMKEAKRMTKSCGVKCVNCPVSMANNETSLSCWQLLMNAPEKYIEIVENWSKAHPRKTQADLFFERYPNAVKYENKIPEILPCDIGILCENSAECCKFESCDDCRKKYWSAPVEG